MKVLNFAVISFSSIFILYYGKFFLLPLFLALFFYIILNSISKNLIDFTKKSNFEDLDKNQQKNLMDQIDQMIDKKYKFIHLDGLNKKALFSNML